MTKIEVPAWTVWVARVLLGVTFIVSGWAKCVDPWGFVYKLEDYLSVWGLLGSVPREFTLIGAVALSMLEFCTGVALATGCLRRAAPAVATVIMAGMLPLSVYIYVADPVADCGCFGDLLVISNLATMLKNIVLAALAVYLLLWGHRAAPGYRPGLQWLVVALSIVYSLTLAVLGWHFQPVADFRPFGVGKELVAEEGADDVDTPVTFVYEKEGRRQEFALDALPDSSWTFVSRRAGAEADAGALTLFDDYGDDVTADVLADVSDMIILTVPEPGLDYLLRARFANELYRYAGARDIPVIGVVAASGDALDKWRELARPQFPVYSASDTSLKQLVRGAQGFVWVHEGRIVLKRSLASLNPDMLDDPDPLRQINNVSDGRVCIWLSSAFLAGLLLLWLTSQVYSKTIGRGIKD